MIALGDILSVYKYLEESGTYVYDYRLNGQKGVTMEMYGRYAVFIDDQTIKTSAEHNTVVAHETGHVATGTTHKACSPFELVERYEYRANKWAVKNLIPVDELKAAMADGYMEIWQLAEYFEVNHDLVEYAIALYRDRLRLLDPNNTNNEST